MAFEKRIWVNVPDPTKLPPVPEGQDALARFDAENMNRIEDGILESALHASNTNNPHGVTPKQINAIALGDDIVVGSDGKYTVDGGLRLGISYANPKEPFVGVGTERGSNSVILATGCNHTNGAKEKELGERCYYYPLDFSEDILSFPAALKLSSYYGRLTFLRSKDGLKSYSKDEILTMQEYEVIHSGNLSTYSVGKVYAGSYSGGNFYGSNNPNTLTFPFVPKLVILSNGGSIHQIDKDNNILLWWGVTEQFEAVENRTYANVTYQDKSVSWYSSVSVYDQLNVPGVNYHYIAIG